MKTITAEDIKKLNDATESLAQKFNDIDRFDIQLENLVWPKKDGVADEDVIAELYSLRDTLHSTARFLDLINGNVNRTLEVYEGKF